MTSILDLLKQKPFSGSVESLAAEAVESLLPNLPKFEQAIAVFAEERRSSKFSETPPSSRSRWG